VFLNLIRNAILGTKPGGTPTIQIEYGVANKVGEVHVIDNGTGVPKELEDRIFEDFFTTRATGEGTGLGLAFCKSVMSEVGGDIEYTRKSDLSDFKLTFHLAEAV